MTELTIAPERLCLGDICQKLSGPSPGSGHRHSARLANRGRSRVVSKAPLFWYSVDGSSDNVGISAADLERMSNPTEFLSDNNIDFYIKVRGPMPFLPADKAKQRMLLSAIGCVSVFNTL